jgi:PAS domain S-box-containing protein
MLEDNPADARLIGELLREAPNEFEVEHVQKLGDALARLDQGGIQLVLTDLTLPDSKGIQTFLALREPHPEVPIIVMSGMQDQSVAMETVEKGAQDYLVKGHVDHFLLVRAMRYALARTEAEILLGKERDLLHIMLDTIPDRIYFKDRESRFIRVSKSLMEMHHLQSPEQILGKTDFDLFTREHAQPAFDDEQEVMRTGKPIVDKIEKETYADGSVTWAFTTKLPLRDKRGNIIGTFGLSRDITELKRAEAALSAERNLLHSLINNLPDRIFVKDTEGRYKINNKAHCAFLGVSSPQEAVGKVAEAFVPPQGGKDFTKRDKALMASGESLLNEEETLIGQDGVARQYLTTKVPLRDEDGKVNGLVCISHDITERKKAEQKLAHYAAELHRRNTEMEEDLHMAREIQDAFIPQHYPTFPSDVPFTESALRFIHRYQPTTEVGGDFFHVLRISDTVAGVFICDVMGHGVRAALITAIQRALVEELANVAAEPVHFMAKMNEALVSILKRSQTSMFASAFYMVVDVGSGVVRYVNAGHPKPLHARREAGTVEIISNADHPDPVLGIFDNASYVERRTDLQPHDLILLYTDGLLEVEGPIGDFYDTGRLIPAVRKHLQLPADELLDRILDDVHDFCGSKQFIDDICVIGMDVQRLCLPADIGGMNRAKG